MAQRQQCLHARTSNCALKHCCNNLHMRLLLRAAAAPPIFMSCAANNWLNGTIPAALRSLKRLQTLGLGTNFLSGPIPSWLGELTALQVLNLGANAGDNEDGSQGLTGTLPEALSQLPQLAVLNVETNALTGSIPEQLCSRNKLKVLKLRSNRLGGVPQYLTQCTELTQLDISNNR